ncbi:MAG: hypothetical protein V3T05_03455 [Myxococcota bacterium]
MPLSSSILAVVCAQLAGPPAETVEVLVSPLRAASMMAAGDAIVLDARGAKAVAPYVPGAVVIDWLNFRNGCSSARTGAWRTGQ